MGIRFRRRLTLFPGVRLNFSKSGISATFGFPGASVNIGKQGAFLNTGIPSTGIYARTRINDSFSKADDSFPKNGQFINKEYQNNVEYFQPKLEGEIKSVSNDNVTSEGLKGLKETFLAALQEEILIKIELKAAHENLYNAQKRFNRFKIIPFAKYIFKKCFIARENDLKEKNDIILELKEQLSLCKVDLKYELDDIYKSIYDELKTSFDNLLKCEYVWDLVAQQDVDKHTTRSAAHYSFVRKNVAIGYKNISFINSKYDAFYFQNANGADLFIYPGFIVLYTSKEDFGLIDFKDLNIDYIYQKFIEEENIPSDSQVVGKTWSKVNKDGSKDLRFKNNYELSILAYGKLHFNSESGLNELYMFSNTEASKVFSDIYLQYKSELFGHSNTNKRQETKASSEKVNWALEVLDVPKGATAAQIKTAYYDLIKKYHPDKVDNLAEDFKILAETKTKELNEAYKILLSSES